MNKTIVCGRWIVWLLSIFFIIPSVSSAKVTEDPTDIPGIEEQGLTRRAFVPTTAVRKKDTLHTDP